MSVSNLCELDGAFRGGVPKIFCEREEKSVRARKQSGRATHTSDVLPSGLLVVHDTGRGGLHTQRQQGPSELETERRTRMMYPKERAGRSKLIHDSIWASWTLNRGEMTPHLLMRPLSWMTILPERWSSCHSHESQHSASPCLRVPSVTLTISSNSSM
jgi:hypothetical protein